ncbi:MAG: hypothetical protein ACJ74J_23475 [Blastocatellia bacterium]
MQAIQCKNHLDVPAADRCVGCAEPFCANCMVDVQGQKYCGSCKVMALRGQPLIEQATVENATAGEALKYALIGLVCFGIVLEPMAISRALRAKREIATDPTQTGEGKANAALIIAIIGLGLWILGLFARFSSLR